jgi:twitching motility protein PilU
MSEANEQQKINDEKYKIYMHNLLKLMVEKKASDLFITVGFPPAIKLNGNLTPIAKEPLNTENTAMFLHSIMNAKQQKEFMQTSECNFAIAYPDIGRFRVNAFKQQGKVGMVLRMINTQIPNIDHLKVPNVLKNVIMEKRGLIIVVGATGSGKSTTLAAMIGFRNHNQAGHIITIEDPIEFVHQHARSIVTQREVGVDTESWEAALKNTLRQAPDVILIGEIRDRETMEYAIAFAETGHLCLATLHANNANQALDRVINFFPEEKKHQLLMDLSLNLKSVVSQRLIPAKEGGRVPAVEILLTTPYIQELIVKGEVAQIKEAMKKGRELGMQTFDQALLDLYGSGDISYEEALRNADSVTDLSLAIKLKTGTKPEEQHTSENKKRGLDLKVVD